MDVPTTWTVWIVGPMGTPYQNGKYQLAIRFQEDHSETPPSITFLTKIYHCSVSKNGSVDSSILYKDWSANVDIAHVIKSLQEWLLTGGDISDPLRPKIA